MLNSDDALISSQTKKQKHDPIQKLHNGCAQFIEERWSLVNSVALKQPFQLSLLTRGNPERGDTPSSILLKFIPQEIWNILVSTVNRNLSAGCNSVSSQRWSSKPTSMAEMIKFYAFILLIESTYGNNNQNLREHFLEIQKKYGKIKGLGMDRFESLRRAFNPSISEIKQICDILHTVFHSHIDPIPVVTVDESVIAYQPSAQVKKQGDQSREPIPVVFLPRKPHPNGLETFLAVTPVDHPGKPRRGLPYILDIHPHLRVGDCSPQQIVKLFMQRWLGESKPHWVGDAAFGSTEVLAEIEEWGEMEPFPFPTPFPTSTCGRCFPATSLLLIHGMLLQMRRSG